MTTPLQHTSLGELGGYSPLLATSLGELSVTVFIDGGAGVKIWFAEGATTIWDALDGPTVWVSECAPDTRWIADKTC